jgi:transcriptional regulator with XRE-family HTH domain
MLSDDALRARLRELLERSGLSMRALSAAFGRDPGYVQSLVDPTRPSRARPTPADLVRASDATGISFVELLEALWEIPPGRLAAELADLGAGGSLEAALDGLDDAARASVANYVAFLRSRSAAGRARPRGRRQHAGE